LTAVQAQGIDPAGYSSVDLLDRLEALVETDPGPLRGRASDQSAFGDFSNTLGQSWVVRAFAAADDAANTASTTRFLLRQQCAAGFFRESMQAAGATCDAGRGTGASRPSVDATALAIVALRAARAAGVRGVSDDIDDALGWLRRAQRPNGAFVGNGLANANTTGLAARALAGSRWRGAAGTAASWLASRQVTAANARGTRLRRELGAVSYSKAAWTEAARDGIGAADRIQWRLATAQAAPGLAAILPAKRLTVRATRDGNRVTVRVLGLAAGERFTVRRGRAVAGAGWAGVRGRGTVHVRVPSDAGRVTVRVVGSRTSRAGVDTVRRG
jgi:hypothetical protein